MANFTDAALFSNGQATAMEEDVNVTLYHGEYPMKRLALSLALGSAAVALSQPAQADVQVTTNLPVVELSVTETVKGDPDIATIGAGVQTLSPTAVEAMRTNAREMAAVIARIKALGVDEKDIQTTGVSLYPQYDYNQTQRKQVFRGYQASNRVSVILRDIDRTGPVLDALVAAGATDLSGPDFSIDDDTAAKAQARSAAMKRAEAMARDYARMAGYPDVRLLKVSEIAGYAPPQPMMRMAPVALQVAEASTPIQPGQIGSSVTVSVTYEMTR